MGGTSKCLGSCKWLPQNIQGFLKHASIHVRLYRCTSPHPFFPVPSYIDMYVHQSKQHSGQVFEQGMSLKHDINLQKVYFALYAPFNELYFLQPVEASQRRTLFRRSCSVLTVIYPCWGKFTYFNWHGAIVCNSLQESPEDLEINEEIEILELTD